MKFSLTILLLIPTFHKLHAQKYLNEIRIESYSPIASDGFDMYLNDRYWNLGYYESDKSKHNRKYINKGISASYIRHYKHFGIGIRVGYLVRTINEDNEYIYVPQEEQFAQTYYSKQTHQMGSIFIQKIENIRILELKLGLEIPYIIYGDNIAYFSEKTSNLENGQIWSNSDFKAEMKMTGGNATGIGVNFGCGVNFNKNKMKIGFEFNQYLLSTRFKSTYTLNGNGYYHYYNPESIDYKSKHFKNQIDFKETVFSNLTPRIFYSLIF